MDKTTARRIVRETFKAGFDRERYRDFINELCNGFDESKAQTMGVPAAFSPHIKSCQRIGTFKSPESELADVLIVQLTESYKLERTRTALRDFVAYALKRGEGSENSYKEAGLVAFVAPDSQSWRFSYVRMEYKTKRNPKTGKIRAEERLTPARRYSYLVGADEECHTAQTRFLVLLQNTSDSPTLAQIEEAFSVESVTKEFFREYARLFEDTEAELAAIVKDNKAIRDGFNAKGVRTVDFAKKLLGQIVFLYFIQKKGWLGVARDGKWGDGPRNFMRLLADRAIGEKKCLFTDLLEPLFYDTLATDRGHEAWCKTFQCRIPFLNGGLFEPLAGYEWQTADIDLPNGLFTNKQGSPAGDIGTGIIDVFDRYNFTVNEAEPLEKEVAIDPEMLGKVFENLIEENRRKGLGAYYTPREIVHYMCQESLINYLDTTVNRNGQIIKRTEVEALIREGEQAAHYEAARKEGAVSYTRRLPEAVEKHAHSLDDALNAITVCDPAIGSGAFPVGMMTEIVRARSTLTPYFNDASERTPYNFKRHAIQNSLYGVDIDVGAVETAKLRLWLSLVVDEEDIQQIKPLPNLDYKVVVGNSLLGVQKNLFNQEQFARLEELKPKFFNESDRRKKLQFKRRIEDLIHELTNGRESFDFEIYFSEILHVKKGFDLVIANPPYLKERDNKHIFDVVTHTPWGNKYHAGKMDYWFFFLHRALEIANPLGIVAFITSRYWLNSAGSKKLVAHIRSKADLLHVVDIGKLPVFEQVAGHHMLHFYQVGAKQSSCLVKKLENSLEAIADSEPNEYLEISEQAAGALFTENGEICLYKAEINLASGLTVGDRYDVTQGVVQNPDKVSAVMARRYELSRGEGVFVLDNSELSSLHLTKSELVFVRPFYDESAVQRFKLQRSASKYLLYLTKKNCPNLRGLPNLERHLKRYRKIMNARRETANGTIAWFQLHWPRDPRYFESPKVVLPSMFNAPSAAYVPEAAYFGLGSNVVGGGDETFTLKLLCALLNSKFGFWWFRTHGKKRGIGTDVGVDRLRQFPLPPPSGKFVEIEKLVDVIITAKSKKRDADTADTEKKIDILIYGLYGLSKDDIELVESGAKAASDDSGT